MKSVHLAASALFATVALAGCASGPAPVEVTRFHDPASLSRLGQGTIFVTAAPGEDMSGLELAPYKAAVAEELGRLGYVESARAAAGQIAEVRLDRFVAEKGDRRGPVSVGVGGSTGGWRSGVGVGVGINLGGGPKNEVGTHLAVTIRDQASGASLWEGRAQFSVSEKSDLARTDTNAHTVASALFREFPGGNGETVQIGVD